MKTKKQLALLAVTLGASAALVACGSNSSTASSGSSAASSAGSSAASSAASSATASGDATDFSAVMITDTGGVDDKSFNQGAWEGLQEWGSKHGKTEGNGIGYITSKSDSDYATNLNTAVMQEFDMIYAIGYKLADALTEAAKANPEAHFAIIDSAVDLPNVASINYRDQESSFLAGVAAGLTTKSNKIGFIGGIRGVVIDKFEAGFVAGVKEVNPDAQIEVQYADSFVDAAKGKSLAEAMYASGVDVIFHASGAVGTGVFAAAKSIVEADPNQNIWVIGVDQDQSAEGQVNDSRNITLASTLKAIGSAIQLFSDDAVAGNFHGGETVEYGLSDDGVGFTDGQLTDEVKAKVAEYKEKIINGEITVPATPEK